jgi:hypothetical protein
VKRLILSGLFLVMAATLTAQNNKPVKDNKNTEKRDRLNARLKLQEENDPGFKKHNVFGIKLSSDGYGISFEKGKYKDVKNALLFQVELAEKKHPKEERLTSSFGPFGQVNSVVIGKANNFYQFKLGVAQMKMIGGKANKNGVSASLLYGGGLSLGLLKPYYIDVQISGSGARERVTIDSIFNNPNKYEFIIGGSGFTYGWNELQIKPGAQAKVAMRFDYGRFNETVAAIETGITADYYFSKIRQLADIKERQLFFSGYVTILFGRRKKPL